MSFLYPLGLLMIFTCTFFFSAMEDEDKSEVSKYSRVEELKRHQEDELKQQVELLAKEKKIKETLELQRRIEKEAKQRHLAELSKKMREKKSSGLTLK